MKHHLRPYQSVAIAMILSAGVVVAPPGAGAQSSELGKFLQKLDPLLSHSSSQGYLGVLVADVDNDNASKLKLKDTRGAIITLIDHDAPAGQVGLKLNDVVLEINGQKVDSAEHFGRILKEIPAGRKVNLLISRDGTPQPMFVQLVDRKTMERDVWSKIGNNGSQTGGAPALGILPGTGGGGDAPLPGFHMPFFGSSLNVGAMVEPLTPQMADYLGVMSGIMIKEVARKSEAAAAGLKEHDVIVKVGNDAISTTADWDRAIRANQGKSVLVTILRDRKQQTVNLQVDSKHKSEVDFHEFLPGLLPDGPSPLLTELAEAQDFKFENLNSADFKIDQKQIDELKRQVEEFRKNFKAENLKFNPDDFKFDPKPMNQLKGQIAELQKNFKPEDFKIDQKQFDELKKQMEEFRKTFPRGLQLEKENLDELQKRIQQSFEGLDQQV